MSEPAGLALRPKVSNSGLLSEPYHHKLLDTPRHIRVLELSSSTDRVPGLHCELVEVSLDAAPEYEALSYSWDAQSPSHPIATSNGTLLITPNCASALKQLRPEKESRTLWIDSICIDQFNIEERNAQVKLMGEIYRNANMVLVWLGDDDAKGKSKKAMEIIVEFGNYEKSKDVGYQRHLAERVKDLMKERNTDGLGPLHPVFSRSWFHRMWIVQEVALAKAGRIRVLCGNESAHIVSVMLAVDNLKANHYTEEFIDAIVLARETMTMISAKRFSYLKATLDRKASSAGVKNSIPLACQILWRSRRKASGDPKDKVFALYGIFHELEIPFPAPDYNKSVQDIYSEAAAACLNHDKENTYLLLTMAPTLHRTEGLPSWVPDWSDRGYDDGDAAGGMNHGRYHAAKASRFIMKISDDNRKLTLRGKILDHVIFCGERLDPDLYQDMRFPQVAYGINSVPDDRMRAMHQLFKTLKSWVHIIQSWVEIIHCSNIYLTGEPVKEALRHTLQPNSVEDLSIDTWYDIITSSDSNIMKLALHRLGMGGSGIEPQGVHRILEAIGDRIPEEIRTFYAIMPEESGKFHTSAYTCSRERSLFITDKGFMGSAPGFVQAGDEVALFSGVKLPLLVRKSGDGYLLVAHSYVHRAMQGEFWSEERNDLQDITLV